MRIWKSTIGQLKIHQSWKRCDEIALEVVAEVEEQLMHEIIEFIVMTIDSYDHDVDEIDTTDFLFGMEGHRNDE